jgi:uncharacterized phage protein gp47/JayE
MAAYGLTTAGYTPPTGNDLLLQFRSDVESTLGIVVDWSPDTQFGVISAATANIGGTVAGASQAVWDAFDPGNATGAALDSIGQIRGVYRQAATYSTATVTLTGTSGIVVPGGSLIQGGGVDGSVRWRVPVSTVLVSGSASVVVQAIERGAISATAGTLITIVTPVAGWTGVTNPAGANVGQDLETDQAYRRRQLASLQQAGARSAAALRAQLLALTENDVAFISSCVVIDNPDVSTVVIGGLTFSGSSFAPIIWPDTLTASQIVLVAEAIYPDTLGTWSQGPLVTDSTGVATTVTGADGFPHPVRWYYAIPVAITVSLALTLKSGYVLADVEDGVIAAVQALFDALPVGATVYILDVQTAAVAVNPVAIRGVATLLDGANADYTPAITEIVQVSGTVVVT